MASSSRNRTASRNNSASKRPASGGRKPAAGRQSRSSRAAAPAQNQPGTMDKIRSNPLLKRLLMPVIFIAVVLVITGIDLLFAWNDYSRFFKILGIELLVAVIVWILKLVFAKSKTSEDSDSNLSEV